MLMTGPVPRLGAQRLPLAIPVKHDCDQSNSASLAYATPGATPTTAAYRSDYLSTKPLNLDINIERKDIDITGGPRKDSAISPPRNDSTPQQVSKDITMDQAATSAKAESALQQAIENQFNMQILLKHNELRLID